MLLNKHMSAIGLDVFRNARQQWLDDGWIPDGDVNVIDTLSGEEYVQPFKKTVADINDE